MAGLPQHPFCLDVRACDRAKGRFIWTIRERRQPLRRSGVSYPTFEAARLAMKTGLARLIADRGLGSQAAMSAQD